MVIQAWTGPSRREGEKKKKKIVGDETDGRDLGKSRLKKRTGEKRHKEKPILGYPENVPSTVAMRKRRPCGAVYILLAYISRRILFCPLFSFLVSIDRSSTPKGRGEGNATAYPQQHSHDGYWTRHPWKASVEG